MASTVFNQMVQKMAAAQMARAQLLTTPSTNTMRSSSVAPTLSAHDLAAAVMRQNAPDSPVTPPHGEAHGFFNRLKDAGSIILDTISRPASGVGEWFNEMFPENSPKVGLGEALSRIAGPDAAKAFGKGFAHQQDSGRTTYVSDVLNRSGELDHLGSVGKFAAGLGADIATDPTSYINPVKGAKGIAGLFRGGNEATVAGDIAKVAPLEGKVLPKELTAGKQPLALEMGQKSTDLVPYEKPVYVAGKEGVQSTPNNLDWLRKAATPRFAAGEGGVIHDAINPVQLADELAASHIVQAVSSMPKLAHPGLDVANLYKTTTEKVTEKVPREVIEEVPVKQRVAAAAKSATVANPKLGRLRAVKMIMMQTPDYKVQGKYSIESMLKAAADDPKRASSIEHLINEEAKSIVKEGRFDALPKTGRLLGKSGEKAPFGLTLEQATHLMTHGKVGPVIKLYDEAATAHAAEFPIHDPSDLQNVFLKNAKGETVSLGQYLSNLGVKVSPASAAIDPADQLLFHTTLPHETPKVATKKVKKTVYDTVEKEVTSTARLSKAETLKWMVEHSDKLSPEELKYLRSSNSPAMFAKRLEELKTKQVAGSFKSLNDLVEAAKAGVIPEAELKQLLDLAGVKTPEGLLTKTTAILKKTGEKKTTTVKPVEPALAEGGKLTRSKKPMENDPWATVPSASELIEKATAGDTSGLVRPVADITQNAVSDAAKALPFAVIENLIDPADVSKYPWLTTIKRAKRTSQKAGEGRARNYNGWNQYSQSDIFRSISKSVSTRYKGVRPGAGGAALRSYYKVRPDIMYSETMSAMRLAEEALRNKGVKFIAGTDNSGILMSLVDVIDSLPIDTAKKYLFTMERNKPNIYPTELMEAAQYLAQAQLHGGNMDVAKEAAHNTILYSAGVKHTAKASEYATDLVSKIESSLPALMTAISKNYAENSIQLGESVYSMSSQVVHNVITSLTNPDVSIGDTLLAIANRNKDAAKIAEHLNAPGEATMLAKGVIDGDLASKGVKPGDLAEAEFVNAMNRAADKIATGKVGARQQASRRAEGLSLGNAAELDLADISEIGLHAGIFRANVPVLDKLYAVKDALGRAFVPHYGNADFHQLVWAERNTTTAFARTHRSLMSNAVQVAHSVAGGQAKQFTQEAFKLLQQGAQPTSPEMQQVMNAIKGSTDILFGGGNASFAARNGFMPEHINKWASFFGVPDSMRYETGKTIAEQKEIWRSWAGVEDPLDALDRMHAAFQKATVDATVGRDFAQFGSRVAKEGYVKITDRHGVSTLANFIDKDLYYPTHIVKQIPYLDKILDSRIWMPGSPGGKQLMRIYDAGLHAWKSGVTVYRPGHHLSNLMGDMTLSFMAGVNNPLQYQKAIRILAGRSKMYGDWDGLKALMSDGVKNGVRQGKSITVGRTKLSDDEIWRAAYKQGLLPDFRVLEDIGFNESQKFGKLGGVSLTKPFGGRVQHAAGSLSQARDHMVRMAHFIDALEKSSAPSIEEAIKEAGATVRKWHPDGTDLTPFERSTMKRLIPFYAWMRKSVPLLVEATLTKPGKALILPKAMYNLAEVSGMDPDSLGDPFPQGTLYPSYMQEDVLGPQWAGQLGGVPGLGDIANHKYGLTLPGDPGTGTLDTLNTPLDTLLNGLSPAIKIPIELRTSKNLGTGANITDKSQYFDAQLPGIGPASNILNTSLTDMSPQQDVQKGYVKPGIDPVALANYLTGLGIKDYSRPQDAMYAMKEILNKARGR